MGDFPICMIPKLPLEITENSSLGFRGIDSMASACLGRLPTVVSSSSRPLRTLVILGGEKKPRISRIETALFSLIADKRSILGVTAFVADVAA